MLEILLLLPLLGALLVCLLPARWAAAVAFLTFAANLGWGLYALLPFRVQNFSPVARTVFSIVPDFGIGFVMSPDLLAGWWMMLTLLFFVALGLFQMGRTLISPKFFYNCLLLLQCGLMGFFGVSDMILFYLFLELTLLPMALLIGKWAEKNQIESALWFLIYTLAGSFLLLASVMVMGWLYQQGTGVWSFNYWDWYRVQSIPLAWQWPLLVFIFLAFAVKLHLFPLHSWLIKVLSEAPAVVNVLLMGVLLMTGTFGMWRLGVWLLPAAWAQAAPFFLILAALGILYAAAIATAYKSLKMILTFAAISHAGFILLGLALGSPDALNGAIFQTLGDALNFGVLFLLVGMLSDRGISLNWENLGGLAKPLPALTFYFVLTSFAVMGLPGLNSFVGEFLILFELFKSHPWLSVLVSSVLVWSAVYMLQLVKQIFWGTGVLAESRTLKDLNFREHLILMPLIVLIVSLGLYPSWALHQLDQNTRFLQAYQKVPGAVVRPGGQR